MFFSLSACVLSLWPEPGSDHFNCSAKPQFIIAGFAKCGTTSLWHGLQTHPGVHVAPGETNYFLKPNPSVNDTEDYLRKLRGGSRTMLRGEKSPAYLQNVRSIARIAKAVPDVKLLIALRHPTDMLISFYNYRILCYTFGKGCDPPLRAMMLKRFPTAPPSFDDVVLRGAYFFGAELAQTNFASILTASGLATLFPRSQIHFVILEAMDRSPKKEWQDVAEFLSLDGGLLFESARKGGLVQNAIQSGGNESRHSRTSRQHVSYDQLSLAVRDELAKLHRVEIPALMALQSLPPAAKDVIRALWELDR